MLKTDFMDLLSTIFDSVLKFLLIMGLVSFVILSLALFNKWGKEYDSDKPDMIFEFKFHDPDEDEDENS